MNQSELERMIALEKRIREIAEEFGLLTADIIFEVVPAQRLMEGMAYRFPSNFSHWSFGRDYDKYKTIYHYTGTGLPYEQVWNFEVPRALIMETNPFALKILVIAHVYGHVDYFLGNRYTKQGRIFSDLAEEARNAATRFRGYESRYGKEEVEQTIDAGMSIQWQQHPDSFFEEELDNEAARERLLELEQAKLESTKDFYSEFKKPETKQDIKKIEKKLHWLAHNNPPQPVYDLLGYVIRYSSALKPWQRDVLTVIRNQARSLAPISRTKMANEGWASFWHTRIMRRLFEERLLTPEEHGVFLDFQSKVLQTHKMDFNWYSIGIAIFEHIKESWNKGRFGREYEDCKDYIKKAYWDTNAGLGTQKIFEVRSCCSDRMIVEQFFTDEFIHENQLYFYEEAEDPFTGDTVYVITEDRPEVIREALKHFFVLYGIQPIVITNSNYGRRQELYMTHLHSGVDLDPQYRDGTLKNLYFLWGNEVYLETVIDGKQALVWYDGEKHGEDKKNKKK